MLYPLIHSSRWGQEPPTNPPVLYKQVSYVLDYIIVVKNIRFLVLRLGFQFYNECFTCICTQSIYFPVITESSQVDSLDSILCASDSNTEESKVNCMNPQMNCWLRWLVQFTIDSFRATSDQVWVGSFRPWTQCFDFFPISRPNKGWILFREVYETFVENGDIRWVWSLWSKCDLIEISCQTFSKSRFRRRNQLSHESCRALHGQEATQTEKKQAWITIFVSVFKNIAVVLFWLFFWGSIYAL